MIHVPGSITEKEEEKHMDGLVYGSRWYYIDDIFVSFRFTTCTKDKNNADLKSYSLTEQTLDYERFQIIWFKLSLL